MDTLFKKVTDFEEFYVEAQTLVEGSIVRAADGKKVKVGDPPRQHETDMVILLHAGDAKLPLTPNHRVPIFAGGDKLANDLQKGDVIFVNGIPTELTMQEELAGKWKVV